MDSSATLALIRKSRQHGGCGLGMGSRGFNKDQLAQVLMIGIHPFRKSRSCPRSGSVSPSFTARLPFRNGFQRFVLR